MHRWPARTDRLPRHTQDRQQKSRQSLIDAREGAPWTLLTCAVPFRKPDTRAKKSPSFPSSRPLRLLRDVDLAARFEQALSASDGLAGAHCVHERWMRGEMAVHIESALERLWKHAAASVPDWLPTRHIDWLPLAYEAAAQFTAKKRGRSNVYLVLLDYSDSRADPYGIYVGMSRYTPSERFDQHKAGIRAAGSVLHRGLEVLTGPTLHLANISRGDAARIEEQLAESLTIRGLFVQGGH